MIPFLDIRLQHQQLREELFEAFRQVYDQAVFSGGPAVEAFEDAFAAYCGTRYAVGVSNGTSALHLALLALGIGPGDEVIVPANSFIATAWGVSHTGATPVFADCLPGTWQLDVADARRRITGRTRAVIGVHLYGQPVDVYAVDTLCREHGLYFVEDAAQAHGAEYGNTRVGSFGIAACFSFYPSKNLGACGEAGAVTTSDPAIAERIRVLRNQGSREKYIHDVVGYNYRMGALEAASLSVKLRYLDGWNESRRRIARQYQNQINHPAIALQEQPAGTASVYHLFVVTAPDRREFSDHLRANGIAPGYHYPVPCHLQRAYAALGYHPGDLPQSEYLAAHGVSLPMYPELSEEQIGQVIQTVNSYTCTSS